MHLTSTPYPRHILEHLSVGEYINLDSLTEPELMIEYYKNFDMDHDDSVDGLEVLKTMVRMNCEDSHALGGCGMS